MPGIRPDDLEWMMPNDLVSANILYESIYLPRAGSS